MSDSEKQSTATKKAQPQKSRVLSDEDVKAHAKQLGIPYLLIKPAKIEREVVQMISEDVARKYGIAVFEKNDGILKVASTDPQNIDALNVLRFIAQKDRLSVDLYFTNQKVLDELYKFYGSAEQAIEDVVQSFESVQAEQSKKKQQKTKSLGFERENLQDAPVAKLVQVIIRHALEGKASDIHIEPINHGYRVRFRLDGILHASLQFPEEVGKAVVSRVKILANLKIDEKRKPQDGRFRIDRDNDTVDFRVSTLPVVEGEKVVMRVLEKGQETFDLKHLGLLGSNREIFLRHIRDPYGMILMTGPTGSGKSTSLYAFLKILNKEERNIITLEDPVEYFIPGINQSQVKPEIGYSFANGLRSILRQDPNVIMVGEIRDEETAELAIHAALTGHLLFSTVHTNNAIGAIPRLVDMNVESFLLSSSLRVVAAQRLMRRICESCKAEEDVPEQMRAQLKTIFDAIPDDELKIYGLSRSAPMKFFKGKGCAKCGKLGVQGRIAIYEVLEINEEIEEIISEREGSAIALERYANEHGMITMKMDGLMKVLLGIAPLSELERVTEGSLDIGGKIDEIAPEKET